MAQQNLIIYPAGCYGTFLEWLLNYLQNPNMPDPFLENGSSHAYIGNLINPPERLFKYLKTGQKLPLLSRIHPNIFEKVNEHERLYQTSYDKIIQEDIDFLKKHFDNILILTFNEDSKLWAQNNMLKKVYFDEQTFKILEKKYNLSPEKNKELLTKDLIEKLRHHIDKEVTSSTSTFKKDNLLGWNKHSVYDFEVWELRELLSLYWFTGTEGQVIAWNIIEHSNSDVLVVTINQFKENFKTTIKLIIKHFALDIDATKIDEKLDRIYKNWKLLQQDINKDEFCKKIIYSVLNNLYLEWDKGYLSLLDEAWLQKSLRDSGLELKCYNLNNFPCNTKDIQLLLEKN
jgi:hypothetical protein